MPTMAALCWSGGMIPEPEVMLNMQAVWSSNPGARSPKHLTLLVVGPGGLHLIAQALWYKVWLRVFACYFGTQ